MLLGRHMASKDREGVEEYTRLHVGGLRVLASISVQAAVFCCLIRYQGKDSGSGWMSYRVPPEVDDRYVVCMPASKIAQELGIGVDSVYQALQRLKKRTVKIACDNEEGYEERPLIETVEGESGKRGLAAIYIVHALNAPLSETNLFIPELSAEQESVTPNADALAKNADALARNADAIAKNADAIAKECYSDSISLINSTYRTDSTYKTTDMRDSGFGSGEQALYEVDRRTFHAECPQCGSRVAAKFNDDGSASGFCRRCNGEVTVSLPDNRATAKNGDGNYVLIDTGAIERPSDSRVHGE